MVLGKNLKIFHKPSDPQRPFSLIVEDRSQREALFFESGVATILGSEEVDGLRSTHLKVCDAYSLLGVLTYNAGNQRILYLVLVNSCMSVGKLQMSADAETEVLRITGVTVISLRNTSGDEERLSEFVKLLSSGIFYFAVSTNPNVAPLDLTVCAQRAALGAPTDNRFFWNRGLHLYMQSFGISCEKWLVKIICGGVEIKMLYVAQHQARACIISRFNCYRAGTRFQVRGANDDGNVANFVETEQMICFGDQTTSFVQIRGSVPLFWEQTGVQVGSHKIKFSRSFETMSPAFERHLHMIKREYGDQVLINLLGSKEGETSLSLAFQRLVEASPFHAGMLYIHFDYHAQCRGGRNEALVTVLQDKIAGKIAEFGLFHCTNDNGILKQQTGSVRTNCLDCLDRTNAVQTFIGLMVLNEQLKAAGLSDKPQIVTRFQQLFAQLWTQNGDHVSRIYAGTGALDGKSKIKDGARSVSRTLQNNLFDTSKQEAMDILLAGALLNSDLADRARTVLPFNLRQVPAFLLNSLFSRAAEFTKTVPLTFWVGTWNVNGGKNIKTAFNKDRPIDDWLLDCAILSKQNNANYLLSSHDTEKPIDIFAVGFEEIVDLNASNIMAASTTNQRQWCVDIVEVINKKGHYVLVSSDQLVGVCLFVFVLAKHVPYLRDVSKAMVKTGLGGATGNKGGVAIRFQLYNSSLCFVCSHFAAGQSNVTERNSDFAEISRKLIFPADLIPHSHDFVFWCGDFNYRLDMDKEAVKSFIVEEDWASLVEEDQLTKSKKAGKVFEEYVEAPIMFAPTYKLDLFSDVYDTSEKARTPAFTDRVLVRGRKFGETDWNKFSIAYYGRTELKSSDHRPVNALVDVDIHVTDQDRCEEVLDDILSSLGPSDGTIFASLDDPDLLYDTNIYQAIMGVLVQPEDQILLIRYSGVNLCVTFSTGYSALRVLEFNNTDIMGHKLSIRLRLEDWRNVLDRIVDLCRNTATALCDTGEPLLLDENEISLHIPYSNPSSGGLNDLDILTGEEGKDGKDFAGSLANMALSEAAEAETSSIHSGSSDGVISPPIHQRVPPPRPPVAKAKVKEVVDPWAVSDEQQHKLVEFAEAPALVPVQKEILVNKSNGLDRPMPKRDDLFNGSPWDADPVPVPVLQAEVTVEQFPPADLAPPPPPPRRRVGQKLPEALLQKGNAK